MGQVSEISPLMEDKVLFCQTVTYNPSTAVYGIVDIQITESLKYSLLTVFIRLTALGAY